MNKINISESILVIELINEIKGQPYLELKLIIAELKLKLIRTQTNKCRRTKGNYHSANTRVIFIVENVPEWMPKLESKHDEKKCILIVLKYLLQHICSLRREKLQPYKGETWFTPPLLNKGSKLASINKKFKYHESSDIMH